MSWESQLSPQEVNYYQQLFQSASKSQEGIVTGAEAVRFFASSGVPNQILSEIWEAADRDKVGYLTPENFAVALKLIACAQHGKDANANVLSTVVPLPQFEGINVVAPSPAFSNASLSAPITAAEREKYLNIFKVHQPVNGVLDGNTAKSIFVKSKLPLETLGQIWNLADTRQSGTLNQTEFIIAMHYIAKLMDGTLTTLPDKLSPAVYQSANGGSTTQSPLVRNMTINSPSFMNTRQSTMTPPHRAKTIDSLGNLAFGSPAPTFAPVQEAPVQWDVTPQEKQQFDAYFDKIDSQKTGLVQGKEAVEFFSNSRLPDYDLAHIWDLADIQQRGALSREEFAVAMHLIHKRLAGGSIPQSLPKSLLPPTKPQQSPFGNSPMVQSRQISSPAPPPTRNIFDDQPSDLLGDFNNDQVSHETNQVNLLQNQMSSLSAQTTGIQQQKVSSENALEQLIQQKKDLEAQMTTVRMSHEASVKELNEIQETVRREEGEWDRVRAEYDAAQQQLTAVQNEIAQTKQTLENGRAETESLRRRVHEIQEETAGINAELEKLRAQTKQQSMMLDINRRQITAAEQDRAQAKRNLEDYKAVGNLNEEESSSDEDDKEEAEAEATKSPEQVPSVISTPALNTLFSPTLTHENKPASPFDGFTSPQATSAGGDDFDAIFGNLSVSSASTPVQAFDPTSWATTASPSKSSRGPPPPPPQSRHHRQPSESLSVISTTSSINKKQRAPPPPPPAATSFIPETTNEDDDFEAAFSGKQLSEAKVVRDDDFADFDDAFSAFDTKAVPPVAQVTAQPSTTNTEWTSSFGGFNFEENNDKATKTAPAATNDDWDSIFGTPSNKPAKTNDGFDDAFSSFGDDFGKQKVVNEKKNVNDIGILGDKIEELIKMGFNEKEAKDALNRYDQDLEKASNFLLDQ